MKRSPIEAILGFLVLVFCGLFLYFAFDKVDIGKIDGYRLNASFTKIGGLEMGADVRINGIKVGAVTKIELDPQTFMANVEMTIKEGIYLPIDSSVAIADSGMLGTKYIRVDPGQQKRSIDRNGVIKNTKDYRSLEENVSEFIFLSTKEDKKSE